MGLATVADQLTLAELAELERAQAFGAAAAAAAEHVKHPNSPNTERTYRVQWRAWERHARSRGIPIVPIDPVELVTYLQLRSDAGAEPNTVRLVLAALCALDQSMVSRTVFGVSPTSSLRADPVVRRWLRGWSRAHPRLPRRQAAAITAEQLEALLQRAQERSPGTGRAQHIALYARDRALILLGVTGAMRISELVALDLHDVTIMDRGLSVLVRRGKNDQHGNSHLRGLMPQPRRLSCPVDAWRCWLAVRGATEGPAFVAIMRPGHPSAVRIDERSARRIVNRRAAAVELELVSSHSMRATFATLATARGKSLVKIADQGNWRKLDVLRPYVRQIELFEDNASSGLLE